MPNAILHIGTEKTGTSALQSYLSQSRPEFRKRGFVFSKVAGKRSHHKLFWYATQDRRVEGLKGVNGIYTVDDLKAFREEFRRDLAAEADACPNATFIFSNEHCHSRLIRDAQVEMIRDLLAPIFDDIRISVYIRRQDELVVSRYSTALKAGSTRSEIIQPQDHKSAYCDYWGLLSRWAKVFGEDKMLMGVYSKAELKDGSIVADFCARTGVPELPYIVKPANESLSLLHQEFLRQMNRRLSKKDDQARRIERLELVNHFRVRGAGRGKLPSRAEAEALCASYAESNERVRARFFPDRATLFDEDFSAYPEAPSDPVLDLESALDMSVELWETATEARVALRAENEYLHGRLALIDQDTPMAIKKFEEAIRFRPDYAEAWSGLGEALAAAGRLKDASKAIDKAVLLAPDDESLTSHADDLRIKFAARDAKSPADSAAPKELTAKRG